MKFLLLFIALSVSAADWPTYRADAARSGVTQEKINFPLRSVWTHQPVHAPRPAWRGPAKSDEYNKVKELKNRQLFDHAFHVVVDAANVYFGSSADDQIHCLDLRTGKEKWTYFTEGPVRFAPTLYDGKLYVGSDDGHAYCISTAGKLIWKKLLAPRDYRIAGNNRIISAWPVRTGILVRDGIAYAGAGMFPKEEVYLMALDSVNGDLKWKEGQRERPAQGYLLLSETRVFVPTGRNNPIVYMRDSHKRDGSAEESLAGKNDAFTLINPFPNSPPKSRKNGRILGAIKDQDPESFATFTGNHMIIADGKSYLQARGELSALDRMRYRKLLGEYSAVSDNKKNLARKLKDFKNKATPEAEMVIDQIKACDRRESEIKIAVKDCILWRAPCSQNLALILAGNTLFAGGNKEVVAYNTKDGKKTWSAPVNGEARGIAVAHGQLLVSTDKGTIHCFGTK